MITPNEDVDPFPFGIYKDKPFRDVPSEYLYKLAREPWIKDWPRLKAYLDKHMVAIKAELIKRRLID